ncbi:MAG: GTP-binding protein [Candidatus Freyarchaeota archaeon]|nr:GTP-binding protein [Candidatus Jordarchaeia archaeon]MBS7269096.1 GTP-binding protein [Candidatus Jordarchaeia archaeon]MBS7279954.1 GTP-binding protein [Candidatus Jordarchaeia archaeon]
MKILVTGSYHSGKSTIIRSLTKGKSISIDKKDTTVALDYGIADIENLQIHLFGTPGLKHFKILRQVLSKGADGVLFLVDSQDKNSDGEAKGIWREVEEFLPGVPITVAANKQDLPGARKAAQIREDLNIPSDIHIIPTVAKTGHNAENALRVLLLVTVQKELNLLKIMNKYDGEVKGIQSLMEDLNMDIRDLRRHLNWLELRGYVEVDWRTSIFWLTPAIKKVIDQPKLIIKDFTT